MSHVATTTVSCPLVAEDLSVTFDDIEALHAVSLTARPGTLTAITGPSGAGKTTLLWALAGALTPARGRVRYGDQPVSDRHTASSWGIHLVPQGNGLASILTAGENVILPLLAAGVAADQARTRSERALHALGLADSANHLIEELSGGQQQRVAVARGLAAHPHVLLADEPTSELDATNRERVIALLLEHARHGAVVIMTTHDPDAATQCDRRLTLDEGHISAL